eukprot:scaffold9276_cov146-Skeletonema_marinoi.AAC.4
MADENSTTITIQLQDKHSPLQNHFEIDTSDNISSIFTQYAHFNGLSLDNLQFTYNDTILSIAGNDTPTSLGMTNDDAAAIISVSLVGQALKEYTLVNSITTNSITETISILNDDDKSLLIKPLKWSDSDGQELCSPPIFIAIDYGLEELVAIMLPLYDVPTKSNNDNNNKTSATTLINTLSSEQDGGGYTPLQWASWMGSLEIVKLLIQVGGAQVDEEAVSLARENDHEDIATYLQQHVDIYSNIDSTDLDTIMDKACRNGDSTKVRELLDDENYNLDQWKDGEGKYLALSPMYMAVKFGHYDVVQLFMDRGGVMIDEVESALATAAAAE